MEKEDLEKVEDDDGNIWVTSEMTLKRMRICSL